MLAVDIMNDFNLEVLDRKAAADGDMFASRTTNAIKLHLRGHMLAASYLNCYRPIKTY